MAFGTLPITCTCMIFLLGLAASRDLSRLDTIIARNDMSLLASGSITVRSESSVHGAGLIKEAVESSHKKQDNVTIYNPSASGSAANESAALEGNHDAITSQSSSSNSNSNSNAQFTASSNSSSTAGSCSSSTITPTYTTPKVVQSFLKFTHAERFFGERPGVLLFTGCDVSVGLHGILSCCCGVYVVEA